MMEIYVARIFDGDAMFEYYATWCLISRTKVAPPENPNEGISEVLLTPCPDERQAQMSRIATSARDFDLFSV